MLVHAHGGADVVPAMALRRNLEAAAVPRDTIVSADHPISLNAKHVLDWPAVIGHEGRPGLGRRHREAGVVVGHEAPPKEAVGGCHGLDASQARLMWQRLPQRPETRSMRPRPFGE
jgi:hypothetical protein